MRLSARNRPAGVAVWVTRGPVTALVNAARFYSGDAVSSAELSYPRLSQ